MTAFDFGHLEAVSEGDREFQSELISVYVSDTQRLVDEIKLALEEQDLRRVSGLAHSIKGASSNVGASGVQAAALALETFSRQRGEDQSPVVWEESSKLWKRIAEEFQEAWEELNKAGFIAAD